MAKKLGEGIIKLNEDADKRSVLDSIDRPIRPLVLELTRVGFHTRFSCCGFTYEGEEEPKSHHEQTYVVIGGPHIADTDEVQRFFRLVSEARMQGWGVQLMTAAWPPEGQEWNIGYTPTFVNPWQENYDGKSLHAYETRLCAIQRMVNTLKTWPTVDGAKLIIDGNVGRKAFAPDWQVQPKQTYVVAEFG